MHTIFLTGHRKSGTSVFHKLFEGHSKVNSFPVDLSVFYAYFPCFVAAETSDELRVARIRKILKKVLAPLEGVTPVAASTLFRFEGFWSVLVSRLRPDVLSDKALLLQTLLSAFGESCEMDDGKAWVVKETSQAIFCNAFMNGMPRTCFINLVRDPRDNYAALKVGVQDYYAKLGENEKKTLASLINRSRMDFLAAQTKRQTFPETFLPVRFEDLSSNTRETMQTVSDFCGIGFEEALLNPTFLGKNYTGNSHEAKKFSGLSMENVGNWRDRISPEEAMIIEYWFSDVMHEFGYMPTFDREKASQAFADFYEWYNCTYFFHDSFAT
ncbi:sulfotransferase [Nioella halotolerans]|uniref:sulfotransferase n=1 Tax=Nioella halotolerans TaxID=2303578 RepID=UPI002698E27F